MSISLRAKKYYYGNDVCTVVYWQPTGGLMAKDDQLGPKVGGHLALCIDPFDP